MTLAGKHVAALWRQFAWRRLHLLGRVRIDNLSIVHYNENVSQSRVLFIYGVQPDVVNLRL